MDTKNKDTKNKKDGEQLSMLPEKPKKLSKQGKSVFNVRALLEKKFHTIFDTEKAKKHPDTAMWRARLGDIEGRCKIKIYARPGQGKSVLVMQLLQYLSEVYGKAAYNSWEEKVNKTMADRIRRFMRLDEKTGSVKDVWFLAANTFEDMCKRIEKNYLRVIVIDSVQYARFTKDQLQYMDSLFAKRHLIIIMVGFGTARGKAKDMDLLHAADVKMYIHGGMLTVDSRYLGAPHHEQLFASDLVVEVDEPEELTDLFTPEIIKDENQTDKA
jgi:hypothetical protein